MFSIQVGQEVSIFRLLCFTLDYRRHPRSGSYPLALRFQPLDSHSLSAYCVLGPVSAERGIQTEVHLIPAFQELWVTGLGG